MSWRTLVINKHSKLSYQNNCLLYRADKDCDRFSLTELNTVIIETTDVVITTSLISKLSENNIKIIFCDEKRNPVAEVSSLYGSHNTSQRVQSQIEWSYENKQKIWKKVIQNKIRNQAKLLKRFDKIEWKILDGYISSVQDGDITNREGFAAKVYFNALFGQRFLRSDGENEINRFLDYGYSLILSTFNREIVKNGNLTQIGINHRNYFNQFNLSSDLMEPFRPIIDEIVYKNRELFFSDSKYRLLELFSEKYTFDGSEMYFVNIVEKYVKTILESLNKNSDAIKEF